MKGHVLVILLLSFSTSSFRVQSARDYGGEARRSVSQIAGSIALPGLEQEVEVLRDTWGVPHIYARTVHDLFMAQGFVVAQDRLWQMELWRRTGEGKLAEILGPAAIPRDRFARLMRYRGDMDLEWKSYSPDARSIIEAFTSGVNANIKARKNNLPLEFRTLGIEPQLWTPDVCLTRMAGYIMTRNAASEMARAQLVREIGPEKTQKYWPTDPTVALEVPRGLDLTGIDEKILGDILPAGAPLDFRRDEGSNNWTVSGTLTSTGKPILANDPHRPINLPSLRYMSHLVGPGWNVIGAGEPSLPGIAAGHNEHVGFGFTIVGIDQQDLYVEELNPRNPLEYRHRDKWLPVQVVREEIRIRGRDNPEFLDLHFTRHGPVIYQDKKRNRAYALRWVGSEPGSAGYLASLSLSQVRNWEGFLKALERWKVPSQNMVYADTAGNIGWQAVGLTPIRKGWVGLLPVPGNGDYEWQGFRPLSELPRRYNPAQGYVATANHNILPEGYTHTLGFEWAANWRFRRIDEVLRSRKGFTVEDFKVLQHDETSIPARTLVPLLRSVNPTPESREAVSKLLGWNHVVAAGSAEAAIYEVWVQKLPALVWSKAVPPAELKLLGRRASLEVALRWLQKPTTDVFGKDPEAGRNQCLLEALNAALAELRTRLGPNMETWSWGALHKAYFLHGAAKDETLKGFLDRGPVSRGGDGHTVNNTGGGTNFRQTSGASYRQILDLSDWDRSVAINVPGQSGEPGSPHYDDLLPLWAEGKYFPLAFSRAAVEKVTKHRLILKPVH